MMTLRVGGGAVSDVDGGGGVGDVPGDAVGDGSVGDVPGVGAAGDADGEGGAGGAPGVGAAGEAGSENAADDAMVDGAAGDAVTVRVLQVMGVGPRMGGRRWFWAQALATPGGGCGGRRWSVGVPVLAVLVASGVVGASPRLSWRRVPLLLLTVRVVDVMVLLMPMARVLQVLYRVLPRVRALCLVTLRVAGGVAGDADVEGAVVDAPGAADAVGVAVDALVYGVASDAVRVYGAAGDDDGEGAVGGGSGCGSVCGWTLACVGCGLSPFLAGGPVGGVVERLTCQSCWCLR